MVPPLPAASRPSKTTTMRGRVAQPALDLDELELAGVVGLLVVVLVEPLPVGVARVEDVLLVGVLERLADLLRRLLGDVAADSAVEGLRPVRSSFLAMPALLPLATATMAAGGRPGRAGNSRQAPIASVS